MKSNYQNMEASLEEMKLPTRDWLQEGCYHQQPSYLLAGIKRKWKNYSPEERAHMAGVYRYPGGYIILSDEEKMSFDVKCNKQIETELSFFKNIPEDSYEEVINDKTIKLTDLERMFITDELERREFDKKITRSF